MDDSQTIDQDRIMKINIEEEMKKSYIDYSMSVITAVSSSECAVLAISATKRTRNVPVW